MSKSGRGRYLHGAASPQSSNMNIDKPKVAVCIVDRLSPDPLLILLGWRFQDLRQFKRQLNLGCFVFKHFLQCSDARIQKKQVPLHWERVCGGRVLLSGSPVAFSLLARVPQFSCGELPLPHATSSWWDCPSRGGYVAQLNQWASSLGFMEKL